MASLATNKRTEVVNAAFLQEIKETNLELWSVLHELRGLKRCTDDPRDTSRRLVDKLSQLRDCIGLEFSLEETYGFLRGSDRATASSALTAGDAKLQHRELYLQLQELCEQAEEAQYRGTIGRDLPRLLADFQIFDAAFREHEELESTLIRSGLGFRHFEQ